MKMTRIENGVFILALADYVQPQFAADYDNDICLAGDDNGQRCFTACSDFPLDNTALLSDATHIATMAGVTSMQVIVPSYVSLITGSFFEANIRPWWVTQSERSSHELQESVSIVDEGAGMNAEREDIFNDALMEAFHDLKRQQEKPRPSTPALERIDSLFA